ncbi:S1 RNA-binding domain-containing protein [Alcaligenes faecalis]|uniref:S1 RNA-binding domain-containing protein n=1 Tax=Alcaligenes faecalis TaxID=511 RepID=UPI0018D10852|nr:S1 RNA-binding domain-containing protein [Alcaligenes faecalis]MBH0311079.1 S1 RNA-binding domain-containing protein [Alcaligenes faecalis]
MSDSYKRMELITESDVEQKFIYKLLTDPEPIGLGYGEDDFLTKPDIRKLLIDKGTSKKLYYPDYAVVCDGLPLLIVEAKAPGSDLHEALREARLYAAEINASYARNINPCARIIATDGLVLLAAFWDQSEPILHLKKEDFTNISEKLASLIEFASILKIKSAAASILSSIRTKAIYVRPVQMLGGKSIANETVGDNSFGTNVSIEYKYLFNPDSSEDREAVVKNAYVSSKRKQAHVPAIDRLIRSAVPRPTSVDARPIADSSVPAEVIDAITSVGRVSNEICLLIGSVGSGKSTFTDFLRYEALPEAVAHSTHWINLNLNKAPLSRDLIYDWTLNQAISEIERLHPKIDFQHIDTLKKIYAKEILAVEKGKAALYPKDSDKYIDIIFSEIDRLQKNLINTMLGMIEFLYRSSGVLLVIVLDNCDKRNREDQLLMFQVATWLKNTFPCMIFLPLRDSTYDQYRNEPPLDTVIKDLVFRIDPPLLEKVIYARLNYVLREIGAQQQRFTYILPNGMKVECVRAEVGDYLRSIVSSLFQDQVFKRIVTGLAGRNIRKGLEILLDFCKSGHIGTDEILKIRSSNGEYQIPNHLISKILLKGKRKYYSDNDSNIKNIFFSDDSDPLPDPFVRVAILQWLKNHWREMGPNRTKGFHKVKDLVGALKGVGHEDSRIMKEIVSLTVAGCIVSESQTNEILPDDLVSIAPAGQIHLDLMKNINYLSSVSEDVLYRENQVARAIADNMIGRGRFRVDSRQSALSNSMNMMNYLASYRKKFSLGDVKVLAIDVENLVPLQDICDYVKQANENDEVLRNITRMESDFPVGAQIQGQIVSMQKYGFFVEFGLNGSGLVHKSNYGGKSHDFIDSFEAGDWVTVEILSYKAEHRKFALRLVDTDLVDGL